ncbi:MAG: anaerobic ribonucleoside-triphosphate reductase activating protein [Thermoproteales archaeon]|nr:anaerobic ribonucleoside-triphosphate reductase activating protein [Thermoproteales archaeon]
MVSGEGEYLFVGGWREVSLVDVLGYPSFTLWLGKCNLRCPWCSNYDLAMGRVGRRVRISEIVKLVKEAEAFVDYFHVTGGEPTLQLKPLKKLLSQVKAETGLLLSLDTNATIPSAVEKLVPMLDHIAIDVKAPLSDLKKYARATGVSERYMRYVLPKIKESIVIAAAVPFLELRTTLVPSLLSCADVIKIVEELEDLLPPVQSRLVYVVQQFIPYEGVKGLYSEARATPAEHVKRCAEEVAAHSTRFEVYYRTLEEGVQRCSTPG